MTPADVRALDSAEARWPHTFFAVEATDEETHQLWYRLYRETSEWVQCHGWIVTLGDVQIARLLPSGIALAPERMPVTVTLTWNLISGHLVCFYDAASQVVDHRMVDEYVRARVGAGRRTNAANFHHCMHEMERATPAPRKEGVSDG